MGAVPVGLFLNPNKFCECPDKQRVNIANWGRGKRTGMPVCVRCKRPSVFFGRGILQRLSHIFGNNMLES